MYRHRMLAGPLSEALADTPVVVVAGPRQAGKSTLAAHVVAERTGTWLNLDDAVTLDAARTDPVGFVSGRTGLVGIDEAQRVPELLLAVKAEVDRDRRPGRFLLTGSTRLLGAPKLADSLAGRMESLTLWPFTQAELDATTALPGFIDRAFDGDLAGLRCAPVTRADVLERAGAGGFRRWRGPVVAVSPGTTATSPGHRPRGAGRHRRDVPARITPAAAPDGIAHLR